MAKIIRLEQDAKKKKARKGVYFSEASGFLYEVVDLPVHQTLTGEKRIIVADALFHQQRSQSFYRMEIDYYEHVKDRRATSDEEKKFREAQQRYDEARARREVVIEKRNSRRKNKLEEAV